MSQEDALPDLEDLQSHLGDDEDEEDLEDYEEVRYRHLLFLCINL